ncbi:hypothetical protein TIFTF001_025972 [Ficus carica]|uniref:Methyltransferase type 11 domain-containing protein n=1 Tax=Ficus carica TaxID=3494 RepID=A0AA88AQN9_FICCA|nr:hypothetical protein TIFTF001_025972 [Ficus carica]
MQIFSTNIPKLPLLLKPFLLSLFFSVAFLFTFLSSRSPSSHPLLPKTTPSLQTSPNLLINSSSSTADLRIRRRYPTYESYIHHQLNKTLNPKLRKIWTTRDWDRKVRVFSAFFANLTRRRLLSNSSKSLCLGARVGQEVASLRRVGVSDSLGIDLVPRPPLVAAGDFHAQPFADETFDFEFSNVFDHALYPWKFAAEIERTLKPGGVCVLHVAISRRADKYSANDLFSVGPLVEMFKGSELVEVREIDGFGLDTEVVFRKKKKKIISENN